MSGGEGEATAVVLGWAIRLVTHTVDAISFPWNVGLVLAVAVAIGLDIYVWVKRRKRRANNPPRAKADK